MPTSDAPPVFGTKRQREAWALCDQAHAAANRGDHVEFERCMRELEQYEEDEFGLAGGDTT